MLIEAILPRFHLAVPDFAPDPQLQWIAVRIATLRQIVTLAHA
jgi:hypothetical protein